MAGALWRFSANFCDKKKRNSGTKFYCFCSLIAWTSLILPVSKAFALLELLIFHTADAVCGVRLPSWHRNTCTEEGLSFPFIDFTGILKY